MAIQMVFWKDGKEVREVSYEGCVISTGEHNYYDDSDFYAIVWEPEKKCVNEVGYASTRYGSDGNYAYVDFDKEKYGAEYERYQRILSFLYQAESAYLLKPMSPLTYINSDKGKRVEVFKGRKVPIGTRGIIFSEKDNPYDKYNPLIMLKTDDGQYLRTYAKNVYPILPSREQLEKIWIDTVGEVDDTFGERFADRIRYFEKMTNIWKGKI